MSAFTLVFYIIPEDLDDLQIPNAFAIPREASKITLNDIEKFFPLKGEHQFRFQFKHLDQVVWLDLNNKKVKVPQHNERIVMKVTRKVKKDSGISAHAKFEYQEKLNNDSLFNL
mmetsp:Transcript_16154/g.14085  ORF Transcript_16154/g.14085 Transcript_16154/m.14085 type:complete len:114 (+) Transcript_16154:53-394(+)